MHELRQPLGIAIVSGLLLSQVLTLYTTLVVYVLIDRLKHQPRRSVAAVGGRVVWSEFAAPSVEIQSASTRRC